MIESGENEERILPCFLSVFSFGFAGHMERIYDQKAVQIVHILDESCFFKLNDLWLAPLILSVYI